MKGKTLKNSSLNDQLYPNDEKAISISEPQPGGDKRKARSLFPTALILASYLFVLAYTIPILPTLILEATGGDQNKAARWNGYANAGKSALDFLCLPVIGALSDRFGRKPLFIFCLVSVCFQLFALVLLKPTLFVLVSIRVFSGTSDGCLTLAFSAITDLTESRNRKDPAPPGLGNLNYTFQTFDESEVVDLGSVPELGRSMSTLGALENEPTMCGAFSDGMGFRKEGLSTNYGVAGAAFGIAFVIGPISGGYASSLFGYDGALLLVAVLLTIVTIVTAARYEETLPFKHQGNFDWWARINPAATLGVIFRSEACRMLTLPSVINEISFTVNTSWMLWLQFRFGWDVADVGIYLSALGFAIALNQICVMRMIPDKFSEKSAIMYGFSASCLYYFLAGFLPRGWMLYFALIILGFSSVANPCLRATLSVYVPDEEQGALQGALESMYTLSKVFACSAYGLILGWSEGQDVYAVGGAINFVAAAIMVPALISAKLALGKYAIKEDVGKVEEHVPSGKFNQKIASKVGMTSCLS